MSNAQKTFFDMVNDFIQEKLISVRKEYTRNKSHWKYDKEMLENALGFFFDKEMKQLVKKETNVTWVILDDGQKMVVGWEVIVVSRKDFVDFMQDIYEKLEHKRLRDLATLQENIAKIDFWGEIEKQKDFDATKPWSLWKAIYSIISNYGKV